MYAFIFSARCNIYISCLCHDASPSVRLSVTEVHWRIIANLGFKFRSHFTAHCGKQHGRRAVLLAGGSSHAMLASARLSCYHLPILVWNSYDSNLRMKIQDFSGPDIPNNQHLLLQRFGPRPMNLIPKQKQDTEKLHVIALLSLMKTTNIT